MLLAEGFKQSQGNYSLLTKLSFASAFMVLFVYADDIVTPHNDEQTVSSIKEALGMKFKMKDMDHLRYLLGLEAAHKARPYAYFESSNPTKGKTL